MAGKASLVLTIENMSHYSRTYRMVHAIERLELASHVSRTLARAVMRVGATGTL